MSGASIPGDRVRVTLAVAVSPRDAFEVFTEEIDRWWRHGVRFRFVGGRAGTLRFEEHEGGRRLVESQEDGSLFEIGRVLVWEPGARLSFEWRGRNFAPDELTFVEITFEPGADGTRVTLEHRGWSTLRANHPARHGKDARETQVWLGAWWADLGRSLQAHVVEITRDRSSPAG